jgi:uncharacterized DUF497 family protein
VVSRGKVDLGRRCLDKINNRLYAGVVRVRWANAEDPKGNTHHITVAHSERGITVEDVEAVLRDPATLKMDLDSGYDRYIGRVGNRYMYVVALGVDEVYPVSARWMADAEWRAYQ